MLPSTYGTTIAHGHKSPKQLLYAAGESIRTTYTHLIEPDASQICLQQELAKLKAKNNGSSTVKNATAETKHQRRNIIIYDQGQLNKQKLSKQQIKQPELPDMSEQHEVEQERPRLQRPAFLSDTKSTSIIMQEKFAGDPALVIEQMAKWSKTECIVSPKANLPSVDLMALRQRFKIDNLMNEPSSLRKQVLSPLGDALSAEVTIEQQL